jgi:hypothetical protein
MVSTILFFGSFGYMAVLAFGSQASLAREVLGSHFFYQANASKISQQTYVK